LAGPPQWRAGGGEGLTHAGQHSAEVLTRWLGLNQGAIEGLAADKIITQRK